MSGRRSSHSYRNSALALRPQGSDGFAFNHWPTPPCLEQVPLWRVDFEYVPSLHFAVAPVASVLPSAASGADLVAVDDLAMVVEGAGFEGVDAGAGSAVAAVAGLALVAF